MTRFDILVRVMPRPSLLDPQGQAVEHALGELGFEGLDGVRVGKALAFHLDRPDEVVAERDARAMCERLLANPVTEDFTIRVTKAA
jgi:phosphoribosylformylglycinamidine synthase